MSATNPFRVSDLISKFGWQVMPYLSNLGPQLLSEAQVLFVDSGHINALDADDTEHGLSFEKPLATIDYAIGLCTAGERSVIFVAPGHNESLANVQIDFDVSDVTVIGIGEGTNKPRIDFDHANSSVNIGANNVHLRNLTFMPSITDVLIAVDIETTVTGTIIEDCDFAEGESANDEFIVSVALKATCTDTKIKNSLFRTKVAAAGCTAAVKLTGISDNVIIEKSRFIGNWSTAAIHNDSGACTDLLIDDCTIKVKDGEPGIEVVSTTTGIIRNVCIEATGTTIDNMIVADDMSWFNNFGVTADGAAGAIIGGGEALAALDTAITGPTAKSLRDILHKDGSHTYSKTTDSLEALSEAIGAISSPTDVTAAVPTSPTLKSLQDILSKAPGSNNYSAATDSLEAIADAILTGTNILAGINLDHLMKTAVVDEQDMSAEIATGSALAHILVKAAGGNVTDFDPTTDSLQAIADAVTGFTTAVSQTPTARSVQDILEKNNSGSFDDSTDSLEAIADRLIDANVDKLTGAADGGSNVYPDSVVQESVFAFLMSKSGNPVTTSYNNTTDSLEAIRDNQQTAARAAIDDAELDHLCELDGSAAYAENIANDSVIAKIMCSGATATANTYDNTTDSLEAIADLLLTGTPLVGIGLDTLCAVDTTIAIDGDLEAHVVSGSVLAHIMSASKDATDFKCSTDSLQAISDFVRTGTTLGAGIYLDQLAKVSTGVSADAELDGSIVALSILGHIMAADADPSSYNASTDSLSAIAASISSGAAILSGINLDHLAKVVCADTTDAVDMSTEIADETILSNILDDGGVVANYDRRSHSLVAIGDDTDAIIADQIYVERGVEKVATSTDDNLFDVTGEVLITSCVGIVTTTAIGGVQNRIKIGLDATDTVDCDFSTETDTNADVAGTRYVFSAANPAVLIPLAAGAVGSGNPMYPWVCKAGVIIQTKNGADGGTTGQINWYITYKPLSSDGSISASA